MLFLYSAGEELHAAVGELKAKVLADMGQLKAQNSDVMSRIMAKLSAAMEQSLSLKAWREQHNLRLLELQVQLQSVWLP